MSPDFAILYTMLGAAVSTGRGLLLGFTEGLWTVGAFVVVALVFIAVHSWSERNNR